MATNVRFLQKQDLTLPMAASAVGLNTVAGLLVHISLLVLAGLVASQDVALPIPDVETTAIVVTALILVSGLIMILPAGRKLLTKYLLPAVRAGASAIVAIAKTPTKLLALFAGSAIITLSYTVAMIASLNAFGADVAVGDRCRRLSRRGRGRNRCADTRRGRGHRGSAHRGVHRCRR